MEELPTPQPLTSVCSSLHTFIYATHPPHASTPRIHPTHPPYPPPSIHFHPPIYLLLFIPIHPLIFFHLSTHLAEDDLRRHVLRRSTQRPSPSFGSLGKAEVSHLVRSCLKHLTTSDTSHSRSLLLSPLTILFIYYSFFCMFSSLFISHSRFSYPF